MNTDTIRNLVVHMRNSVTNLGVMPEYYRDNLDNICTLLEREIRSEPPPTRVDAYRLALRTIVDYAQEALDHARDNHTTIQDYDPLQS
jgi:hypothetical protein